MCEYCEYKDEKEFQPPNLCNDIFSNLNINKRIIWEARVYDIPEQSPEILITSQEFAQRFWGYGMAAIWIPIRFCPNCGRRLGKKLENEKAKEGGSNGK